MGKPKILLKTLYQLLQSQEFTNYISWTENGKSFQISDPEEFEKMVMPDYFASTQIRSLYRQLNSYGFKMKTIENKSKVFSHKWFSKGNYASLQRVERSNKLINEKQINKNELQTAIESIQQMKIELRALQQQQLTISKQLRIHTQIQTIVCQNIQKICTQMRKQELDLDSAYFKRFEMFFRSMIEIFKGFHKDIAIAIMMDLHDIGGPLTPALSPLIFPYI